MGTAVAGADRIGREGEVDGGWRVGGGRGGAIDKLEEDSQVSDRETGTGELPVTTEMAVVLTGADASVVGAFGAGHRHDGGGSAPLPCRGLWVGTVLKKILPLGEHFPGVAAGSRLARFGLAFVAWDSANLRVDYVFERGKSFNWGQGTPIGVGDPGRRSCG